MQSVLESRDVEGDPKNIGIELEELEKLEVESPDPERKEKINALKNRLTMLESGNNEKEVSTNVNVNEPVSDVDSFFFFPELFGYSHYSFDQL